MDYGHPALADRLGAEYAAGLMRGGARRRLESLLPAHPTLRAAVEDWLDRLMPLTQVIEPIAPSPGLWPRIEGRIHGATPAREVPATARATAGGAAASLRGQVEGWWQRLVVWRIATGLAGAAALGLALVVASPAPVQPPIVLVLAPTPAAAGAAIEPGGLTTAAFVAGISADGRAMVTRPVRVGTAPTGRALELWALPPAGAAPRSLGLIAADRPTVVERGRMLEGATGFAVSLEPPGGSPTGAPTGPVVYAGQIGS